MRRAPIPRLTAIGRRSLRRHRSPRRRELDWGYSIPYMLTGQLNIHPRMAIKMREGSTPDNYVEFYDSLTEDTD